ncbi:hypothetical protein [Actinoplanes ianthinogenes]|nr:hypothetical protein [Actinoplanes ianthinogenes]
MADTGDERADPAAGDETVAPVPTDTLAGNAAEQDEPTTTGDADKTAYAPLAQWAIRAGGRPQPAPGSGELQTPADPWPEPIQGLVPPLGQPPFEAAELLRLAVPEAVPPKPRRRLGAILAAVAVALLMGAAGVLVALWPEKDAGPVAAPTGAPTEKVATKPAETTAPPATPAGPKPRETPLSSNFDVDPICAGEAYWPMQPKRTGRAPHPVLVYGDQGNGDRLPFTMFKTWFLKGKAKEAVWSPQQDPAKIQMVACVDRVSAGAKLRTCTYKAPAEPGTGTMYRASYRLHVYETATGRRVLDTRLAGTVKTCPYALSVPTDKKLYMEVSEEDLVAALGKLVEG